MQITRIILENIKSYRRAVMLLGPGTTAIRGHNGAGKSTIVEAIGFALFNFLPYDRARFVREGEKSGKVVISFLSADDDCLYVVERRCALTGSGGWFINDEHGSRIVEGKDDVLSFLRRHLGIHSTVTMADLFDNAIAVQQGTFTADFLMTPQMRKKKFDALLQIEDYRHAADNLRDTERYLHDTLHMYDTEITTLTMQTTSLEEWQQQQLTLQGEFAAMSQTSTVLLQQRSDLATRLVQLEAQSTEVQQLAHQVTLAKEKMLHTRTDATVAQQDADRTTAAQRICQQTAPAYTQYQQAQAALTLAHTHAEKFHQLDLTLARIEQQITVNADKLVQSNRSVSDAAAAAQACQQLRPLVEQQHEYEAERMRLQGAKANEAQSRQELDRCLKEIRELTAHIHAQEIQLAKIHRLAEVALALPQQQQALDIANQTAAASGERRKQLTNMQAALARQQQWLTTATAQLAKATTSVAELTASAAQLAELPQMESRLTTIQTQLVQGKSELEQADKELHASHGGLCPYLKEPCLNMRQKGMANLEEYFGDRISNLTNVLMQQEKEQATLLPHVTTLQLIRARMDHLPTLRATQHEAVTQVQTQEGEIALIHQQIASLMAAEEDATKLTADLPRLRQQVAAGTNAASDYATLPIVLQAVQRSQAQQLALSERRAAYEHEIELLQHQSARLPELDALLLSLNDPRQQFARSQVVADLLPQLQHVVVQQQALAIALMHEKQQVQAQLAPFADLKERISMLQESIVASHAAYTDYLQHQVDAARATLACRQADTLAQLAATTQQHYTTVLATYEQAASNFSHAALQAVQVQLTDIEIALAGLAERQANANLRLKELAVMISEAIARRQQLKGVRVERDVTDATNSLLAFCRTTLKDSGPLVTHALLTRISSDANRIYGEIIGDRSTRLTWSEDYEIELQCGTSVRTFAQLSGGEQMSAALAVRLALLRTLTRSHLAIFDEPTQNMDGERRANLAEQIRRVHDFEQVLVISHDDTFEEGLDAIVRVAKHDGESTIARSGGAFHPLAALTLASQPLFAE